MSKTSKELKIEYKYNSLPEDPKYVKPAKKKKNKKSNHKHIYEPCLYDTEIFVHRNGERVPMLYYGTYCKICGRIGDIRFDHSKLTQKLPIYKIDMLTDKYVSLKQNEDK